MLLYLTHNLIMIALVCGWILVLESDKSVYKTLGIKLHRKRSNFAVHNKPC